MAVKLGILLATLVGAFAYPAVQNDMPFFDNWGTDMDSRIIGGTVAREGSWPWMVALTVGVLARSFYCGASLISDRHILTAAHCVDNKNVGSFRAHVGSNSWSSGGHIHTLRNFIVHPEYEARSYKNDIAIAVSNNRVTLSTRVRIINLNFNWIDSGVSARIAGWGRTRMGGSAANQLQELRVTTVDGRRCGEQMRNMDRFAPPVDPRIEVCTLHSVGHGICNGDSGSPVISLDQRQIGIVSWMLPCARGAPDVHVRVSAYRNFITDILNNT